MEQTGRKLVRISDFCNRSKRHRRREHKTADNDNVQDISLDDDLDVSKLLDNTFDSLNTSLATNLIPGSSLTHNDYTTLEEKSTLVVDVSILEHIPREREPSKKENEDATARTRTSDEYATIYAEDIQLLLEIQIFNGDICMLATCREDTEQFIVGRESGNAKQWIPAIIKVLPSSGEIGDDCISVKSNTESECPSNFRIFVPPTLAATAGLYDHGCLKLPLKARISKVSKSIPSKSPCRRSPSAMLPYATKAKIIEVYYPPCDHLPSIKIIEMSADELAVRRFREEKKSRQVEMLQQFFFRIEGNNKKAAPRLATIGTIFAVVDGCTDDNCTEKDGVSISTVRSLVRFYTILEIETDSRTLEQCTHVSQNYDECFCWISSSTELMLVSSRKDALVTLLRMPRLSSLWQFEMTIRNVNNVCMQNSVTTAWSHPNFITILEAIIGVEGMLMNAKERILCLSHHILHIVGNENNHINVGLDAVADSVGRNIVHISGLASFAFNSKSSDVEGGKRSVVGSISDKILGMKLALKAASKSSPCILHICLDGEISDTDDIESRHDEENRLLSCLQEGIIRSYSEFRVGDFPPIIVVISTQHHMKSGPLSSAILFDSILIDVPNDTYAKALWNDDDTFRVAKNDLAGRCANEIHYLGNKVRQGKIDKVNTPVQMVPFSVDGALIDALDCKDDVELFQSSSDRLSSSLIPNVKWDDIGGLSHVRDEIIDAIELPLLHPHLFAGSRRSGILFFGPPGSGKTLVAKAVASECGLPFISVKGPELLGSYVGESEANIRKAFANAREAAASCIHKDDVGAAILFFDEIDSLAPRRGELGDGGGVMERVVSTLLGEMDRDLSIDSSDCKPCHVFVIGATNRPDLLDPSLLRPGRFDRIIYLGLAKEREDRIQILAAQTRKFVFHDGVDSATMAAIVIDRIPQSLSGADFSGVASGALMLALERVCDEVDYAAASNKTTVKSTLRDWSEDRLTPRVRAEDFIASANDINPSVSEVELKKYEAMRNEYCQCRE